MEGGGTLRLGEGCPFSTPAFSMCKYILENSWAPAYVWGGSVPTLSAHLLTYTQVIFSWREWLGIKKA